MYQDEGNSCDITRIRLHQWIWRAQIYPRNMWPLNGTYVVPAANFIRFRRLLDLGGTTQCIILKKKIKKIVRCTRHMTKSPLQKIKGIATLIPRPELKMAVELVGFPPSLHHRRSLKEPEFSSPCSSPKAKHWQCGGHSRWTPPPFFFFSLLPLVLLCFLFSYFYSSCFSGFQFLEGIFCLVFVF